MAKLNAAGGCVYYTSQCCDSEMKDKEGKAPEVKVEGLVDTLVEFPGGEYKCGFCDKPETLKPFKLKVG